MEKIRILVRNDEKFLSGCVSASSVYLVSSAEWKGIEISIYSKSAIKSKKSSLCELVCLVSKLEADLNNS